MSQFCQHCGTELQDGHCPKCGTRKAEVYSKDYFKGKRPMSGITFRFLVGFGVFILVLGFIIALTL